MIADDAIDVSVVIPAHNAAETIPAQLSALARQVDAPRFEVIVVANRCTDSTVQISRTFEDRLDLRVIEADDMGSAAYARNVGARAARGDFLLFCDADDVVGETWVREMRLALNSADFVGGRISVVRDGLPDWIYNRYYQGFEQPFLRANRTTPFVISASLGVRRDAFTRVGGFDQAFGGAGWEEADFSVRMLQLGYRIGVARRASVSYSARASARSVLRQQRGYAKGFQVFASRHGTFDDVDEPVRHAMRLARRCAYRVVKERRFSLKELALDLWVTDARWRARRTASTTRASLVPERSIIAAPPGTPAIAGLGFDAHNSNAVWYGTDGVERLSMTAVAALSGEGVLFVDVGANIGLYTVLASKVAPACRVVSFEPDRESLPLLQANVSRHNVSADIRDVALAATSGQRQFHVFTNHEISGFGSSNQDLVGVEQSAQISVSTTPLDEQFESLNGGALKIDVEGFECEVLGGGTRVLNEADDLVVLVEVNPRAMQNAGFTLGQLLDHFDAASWRLWLIEDPTRHRPPSIIPATRELVIAHAATRPVDWYANLLAVKGPRADQVDCAAMLEAITVE